MVKVKEAIKDKDKKDNGKDDAVLAKVVKDGAVGGGGGGEDKKVARALAQEGGVDEGFQGLVIICQSVAIETFIFRRAGKEKEEGNKG